MAGKVAKGDIEVQDSFCSNLAPDRIGGALNVHSLPLINNHLEKHFRGRRDGRNISCINYIVIISYWPSHKRRKSTDIQPPLYAKIDQSFKRSFESYWRSPADRRREIRDARGDD